MFYLCTKLFLAPSTKLVFQEDALGANKNTVYNEIVYKTKL